MKLRHRAPGGSPPLLAVGSLVALGSLGVVAGCGGGGSSGGVDRPSQGLLVGRLPVVQRLTTPLGLIGSRGSGEVVFVSYNLQDREFNKCQIQVEYGYDVDGDGEITGSEGDPSPTDEYFPCTPAPIGGGLIDIDSARGRGAENFFAWNSGVDIPGQRLVTLDYDFTPSGRQNLLSDGSPAFVSLPGIRLRMRANDSSTGEARRWGAWSITEAADLNNNSQPAVVIESGTGLNGVTANAQGGAAATRGVVLNFRLIDEDSASSAGVDSGAVHVDYAAVPPSNPLATEDDWNALVWLPASPLPGTADTGLTTAPSPGALNTFTWDSAKDIGTEFRDYVLRITPFDSKSELGATVRMVGRFRVDNFTIFTDSETTLSSARVGHRATTLADDRVLITGGRTTAAGASVQTAELFYPSIGQTTKGAVAPTGSMNTPRSYHSQTRLFDDRVLVAGGFDASGNPVNSIEIYNPATGTWTTLPANLGTARARHTAVLLNTGDVLFAGGVSDSAGTPLSSAAVFRSATETVVPAGSTMLQARHSVAGAILPDGRVLIPGGKGAGGVSLSSVEIYNPLTNTFSAGTPMAAARSEHSVTATTSGLVVVAGGVGLNTVSVYDPVAGTWDNSAPTMASVRAGHVGILMGDGQVLLAGGHNGATVIGGAEQFDPDAMAYDPANGGLLTARRDAATVILNNGRALVVGGTDAGGNPLASIEIFTPDKGFNLAPSAAILSPSEPQSWAFGALFDYRLIDPEQDAARVVFQYSIGGGPWLPCTPKDDTIAGDTNEGVVDLATTAAASTLPIDPILKNTVGDHRFIWDIAADIPQADYPVVRARVVPFGAARGAVAVTNAFRVIRNSRVIPRFAPWTVPAAGTVTIDYHLQDPDPDVPTANDARVVFEYAIDLNGDRQILEENGEAWATCTMVAGGDGLGAGYTLKTSTTYSPTITGDADGWHTFVWDSVRDIGSPRPGEQWNNILVRITPYDFPAGDAEETKGRQEILSNAVHNFSIVLDPTGLSLESWGTEAATYSGTPIGTVRLDEILTFNFSNPVDPTSISKDTIQIRDLSGRTILGAYERDPVNHDIVRFYPQIQEIVNGSPKYNGTESNTILTRGVAVRIYMPAYVKGSDAGDAVCLRKAGWAPGDPTAGIVLLVEEDYTPAFTTTTASGAAAYVPRVGPAPVFGGLVPTGPGGSYSSFSFEFAGAISGESVNFSTLAIRVDIDGDGVVDSNDSVIPGSLSVAYIPGSAPKTIFTFSILSGYAYPGSTQIIIGFNGMTTPSGTAIALAPVTFMSPAGGAPVVTTFFDSFTSTTNRDPDNTNALWNAAGFAGMITGLRDGGSGADGVPSATLVGGVRTFSAKAVWNFTTFTVPAGETWRFTGGASNDRVEILVVGSVSISGIVDVSGTNGEHGRFDSGYNNGTYVQQSLYYITTKQTAAGGVGIAGGGAGGASTTTSTTASTTGYAGVAGTAGKGSTSAANAGDGGKQGTSYTIGHGDGGGGGHAEAGGSGGKYGTSTSAGNGGVGGTAYGNSTFTGGMTAGSGGGGGARTTYVNSSTYGGMNYLPGGGGGAGGGAVKFACNGTFFIAGSGLIDASGGHGGNGFYFCGSGGGGSGGSVWIITGGGLTNRGVIDVSGGRGGRFRYYKGTTAADTSTSHHFGGNGSNGRVRLEAPNLGSTITDFLGGCSIATVSAGSLNGGTGALGTFPGSSTTTINIDSLPKVSGVLNYTSMNIPAGVTVTLTGTVPAKMRFNGNVTINGVLRAIGGNAQNGAYAGGSGAYNYPVLTPAAGGPGGSNGGIPNGTGQTQPVTAGSGAGTGGGKGATFSSTTYKVVYSTWSYTYYYYPNGGGGGSNMLNLPAFQQGTNEYYPIQYGNGPQGAAGATYSNPDNFTMANLVGGSGGGAGMNMHYLYNTTWNYTYGYTYGGGGGGAGGGAIGIETTGSFTMGASARIDVLGGNGGYGYSSAGGGGGGGGSGGNVLIRANSLAISNGARIDTTGGLGNRSYNQVGYYQGGEGGDGGLGATRIETATEASILNRGSLLGITASTGSLSTAAYVTGDKATTLWQVAPGLSPDFTAATVNKVGAMKVYLEGAMAHPVTGLRDDTNTVKPDILVTSFNATDGYKFWRLVFQLDPPSGALPEVYDVTVSHTTK